MPVVIVSKTRYRGVATPTGLNVETMVVDIGAQTDDYIVEGYIDLSALTSGDTVRVVEYIAVDGINLKPFITVVYEGPIQEPVIRLHTKTLLHNMRYRVTVTQTAGVVRSFPFGFILEVLGEV